MKRLELTQGQFAIVDDDDYEKLSNYHWYCNYIEGRPYANRVIYSPHRTTISMHRAITAAKQSEYVDHINRNTLDNRKKNLRICTNQQNSYNCVGRRKSERNPYKGVTRTPNGNYEARIYHNGRTIHLGTFKSPEEAARKRDSAALELQGEFAYLNNVVY